MAKKETKNKNSANTVLKKEKHKKHGKQSKKQSEHKSSKNYCKAYRGQGR